MSANYLKPGSYNVICERCGFKYKAEETRMEWTGLRVCTKHCWEARNPLDFQPPLYDHQAVPNPSPDQAAGTETFTYPSGILLDNNGEPILDNDGNWIIV